MHFGGISRARADCPAFRGLGATRGLSHPGRVAHKAIIGATRTNAELFNLADRIGTIEVGKDADLVLVAGGPLNQIGLLADPASILLVIQRGTSDKDVERRAAAA